LFFIQINSADLWLSVWRLLNYIYICNYNLKDITVLLIGEDSLL